MDGWAANVGQGDGPADRAIWALAGRPGINGTGRASSASPRRCGAARQHVAAWPHAEPAAIAIREVFVEPVPTQPLIGAEAAPELLTAG